MSNSERQFNIGEKVLVGSDSFSHRLGPKDPITDRLGPKDAITDRLGPKDPITDRIGFIQYPVYVVGSLCKYRVKFTDGSEQIVENYLITK